MPDGVTCVDDLVGGGPRVGRDLPSRSLSFAQPDNERPGNQQCSDCCGHGRTTPMPPHGSTVASTQGYLHASYAEIVRLGWAKRRKLRRLAGGGVAIPTAAGCCSPSRSSACPFGRPRPGPELFQTAQLAKVRHPRPVRRRRHEAVHADHRRHRGRAQGPARPAARPRRARTCRAFRRSAPRTPSHGTRRARSQARSAGWCDSTRTPGRTARRSATRCSRASTSATSSTLRNGDTKVCYRVTKRVEVDGYATYDPFYELDVPAEFAFIVCSGKRRRARRLGQADDLVRRRRSVTFGPSRLS